MYFRCVDRAGVVHLAYEPSRFSEGPSVDETVCGESNFFESTSKPVTCVVCLAEEEDPQ